MLLTSAGGLPPAPPYARILRLESRLARAAAEMAPGPGPLPPAPRGMRPLLAHPPRLTLAGPAAARMAFTRWLLWRLWLGSRLPTPVSMARCLAELAARARVQLATRPDREPSSLRAASDDDGEGDGGDAEDAADAAGGLSPEEIATLADAAGSLDADAFAAAGALLDLEPGVFAGLQEAGSVSAFAVLGLLEGMWNGQNAVGALRETATSAGVVGDFSIIDPLFYAYLREQSGGLITDIDSTTRTQVARILWQLAGGGQGAFTPQSTPDLGRYLAQMRGALGGSLSSMSRARAYMIATTEMARSQTFGTMASFWMMGVQQKRWLVTAGACLRCVAAGEVGAIPIAEAFPGPWMAPPAHPLCRCALSAYVPENWQPQDWPPRSADVWTDALADLDWQAWPAVGLPDAAGDAELPTAGPLRVALSVDPPAADTRRTGGRRPSPQGEPRPAPALDALVAHLLAGVDVAADRWAAHAHLARPTALAGVRALAQRPARPGESQADARFAADLAALFSTLGRALRAH